MHGLAPDRRGGLAAAPRRRLPPRHLVRCVGAVWLDGAGERGSGIHPELQFDDELGLGRGLDHGVRDRPEDEKWP